MLQTKIKPRHEFDPNGYQNQKFLIGSAEEKTFCAFLSLTASRNVLLNPQQFLIIYIEMIKTVHAGLKINYKLHPDLKGTQIVKDVDQLKGKDLGVLLQHSVFEKIVFFLTGGDKKFREEAKKEFSIHEAKLLVSHFFQL